MRSIQPACGWNRGTLAAAVLVGATAAVGGCSGAPPQMPPNVARGLPVALFAARGDPLAITDGRLEAEGASSANAVLFDGVRSAVVIDLEVSRPVAALRIQAGGADVYWVESSIDDATWSVLWRVAPLPAGPGLRTRTMVLPERAAARWLRIRPTTSRSPAISEVEVFEGEPAAWPPLDLSLSDSRLPLWPALTREKVDAVYQALASLLVFVVGWSVLARRSPGPPREERRRRALLVAVGTASLLAWPNLFNFHYYGALHKWEFFHYYLGGKYLRELGYDCLYVSAAMVDAEEGNDLKGRLQRDLRDNRLVPAAVELARSVECRARFPASRWEDFRRDARFIRASMGYDDWAGARSDHGFNGTPAWALLGGFLADLAPASPLQFGLLGLLDVGFILGTFIVLGRTFGLEVAGLAAGLWGVNTLNPFGWTGGGFLRYDWLFWLVAGVAALKSQRSALAGFALGYSSMLRVFPACAVAGLVLGAVMRAVVERDLRPLVRYGRFVAGAAAAALLLVAGSSLMAGRTGIWRDFARNTARHLSAETYNSIGLRPFLLHSRAARMELMSDPLLVDRHARWEVSRRAAEPRIRVAYWAAAAAFVLLLGLAVRQAPDWVAAVLGVGLAPVLFTLSSYYYSMLVVFAVLWPVSASSGLALASLVWLTNVIMRLWSGLDDQYASLSLAVILLVTGVTVAFARRSVRTDEAERYG